MTNYITPFLLCVAGILPGCSAVHSFVGDDKTTTVDPLICSECGSSPNCSAPGGCVPGPFMDSAAQSYSDTSAAMATPELLLPPTSAVTEAEQWAPRNAWLPPGQSSSPANSMAACEAQLAAARIEFDAKLQALESRFELEKQAKQSLTTSLESVNSDVSRLSREVEFWRDEVRRIDRTTEMQHQSDMASLQSISQMIESIRPVSSGPSNR